MSGYLLDTTFLAALLNNRTSAVALVSPWVAQGEAGTSILSYGEMIEYLKSQPAYPARRAALRTLLRAVIPYFLTYDILERYADIRRALRPPFGPGLIGDIDTLIAATALEHGLTLVTADSDFARVPGLAAMILPRPR